MNSKNFENVELKDEDFSFDGFIIESYNKNNDDKDNEENVVENKGVNEVVEQDVDKKAIKEVNKEDVILNDANKSEVKNVDENSYQEDDVNKEEENISEEFIDDPTNSNLLQNEEENINEDVVVKEEKIEATEVEMNEETKVNEDNDKNEKETANKPKRMYTVDLYDLIVDNQFKLLSIPSMIKNLNLPYLIQNNIQNFMRQRKQLEIENKDVRESLTEKVVEFVELLDNADNDEYPNHLSIGNIINVGLSAIRRCFMVICNKDEYPFVEEDSELIELLKIIYLFIYSNYLIEGNLENTKKDLTTYMVICLELCCYNNFRQFNSNFPFADETYWITIYDAVFDFMEANNLEIPYDHRPWKRSGPKPVRTTKTRPLHINKRFTRETKPHVSPKVITQYIPAAGIFVDSDDENDGGNIPQQVIAPVIYQKPRIVNENIVQQRIIEPQQIVIPQHIPIQATVIQQVPQNITNAVQEDISKLDYKQLLVQDPCLKLIGQNRFNEFTHKYQTNVVYAHQLTLHPSLSVLSKTSYYGRLKVESLYSIIEATDFIATHKGSH